MTSKEALSDLFFLAIGDEKHTRKCKETIEKDLKILEREQYDPADLEALIEEFNQEVKEYESRVENY